LARVGDRVIRRESLRAHIQQMDRPRVGVPMLGAGQKVARGRCGIDAGQHRHGTLKNFILQADANLGQILRAVDRCRFPGGALEPVVDRADADGEVEHVAQQFPHPAARAAADQGQRQHQLIQPSLGDRQVEQNATVAGGEREVQCFHHLVFLPVDELPTDTLLVGKMRNWLGFHQRQKRDALARIAGQRGRDRRWKNSWRSFRKASKVSIVDRLSSRSLSPCFEPLQMLHVYTSYYS
jgi:hypothetical protein